MPLAKTHVVEGRYDDDRIAKVSGAIQAALMNTLRVPPEDFYQVTFEFPKKRFLHTPSFVGMHSTDDLIILDLTFIEGRSKKTRLALLKDVNPEHVAIVIHNYRWRLGLAEGESKYEDLEKRLAAAPAITVPTITLEGDANSAPHPEASAYAKKFSGKYAHQIVKGGVGHNLPQEAPRAFAEAVVEIAES